MKNFFGKEDGQSLIEIIIGLAIGAILIGSAALSLTFILRSSTTNQNLQGAARGNQELLDKVRSFGSANWQNVYGLTKGTSTPYFLIPSSTNLLAVRGKEGIVDNDIQSGIVAHFKFDEDVSVGSNVYDFSGNNNLGTLTNPNRSTSTCRIGSCLIFNGTNYGSFPDSSVLDITEAITISAWVKPGAGNVYPNRIIDKGDDSPNTSWEYSLLMADADDIEFSITAGGSINELAKTANGSLPANAWTNVVGVYDGASIHLYINGQIAVSTPKSGLIETSSVRLALASRALDFTQRFIGTIDDIRIYKRALSPDEIKNLYNSVIFNRSFFVEDVCRSNDSSSTITGVSPCVGGTINDPSTQKVSVATEWTVLGKSNEVRMADYLARWKNKILRQTDWFGGAGEQGPLIDPNSKYASSTNIDETGIPGSIRIKNL